jgi:hypothetical protein
MGRVSIVSPPTLLVEIPENPFDTPAPHAAHVELSFDAHFFREHSPLRRARTRRAMLIQTFTLGRALLVIHDIDARTTRASTFARNFHKILSKSPLASSATLS